MNNAWKGVATAVALLVIMSACGGDMRATAVCLDPDFEDPVLFSEGLSENRMSGSAPSINTSCKFRIPVISHVGTNIGGTYYATSSPDSCGGDSTSLWIDIDDYQNDPFAYIASNGQGCATVDTTGCTAQEGGSGLDFDWFQAHEENYACVSGPEGSSCEYVKYNPSAECCDDSDCSGFCFYDTISGNGNNQCVECLEDEDCGLDYCDPPTHTCVECWLDTHCDTLFTCESNRCSCTTDPTCEGRYCEDNSWCTNGSCGGGFCVGEECMCPTRLPLHDRSEPNQPT
jgi:hypothetical protein